MLLNERDLEQNLVALKQHAMQNKVCDIRQHFLEDKQRFAHFSLSFDDLLFDFSKCGVTTDTLRLLDNFAVAAGVLDRRDAMFAGEAINTTEGRSVLHTALRLSPHESFILDGCDIAQDIQAVLSQMEQFSREVRSGCYKGYSGEKITDVVNIGIGGSNLGPEMVIGALKPYHDGPRCHFISNVDGAHITDILADLNPRTTLFIIASKTFTTVETLKNAQITQQWICTHLGAEAIKTHFVAVSCATKKVIKFGIDSANIFKFWDWVGGRYSVWSAIGLIIMLAIGEQRFHQFLEGARQMDQNFKRSPLDKNIPIRFALLGFWHRVICGYPSRAVIPYAQRLARFPAYLQQLDMESNGKNITLDEKPITIPSGPVIWGGVGTDAQHAFFQFLHQGTDIVPVEFILFVTGHETHLHHMHDMLVANCLAQSEILMKGRSYKNSDDGLVNKQENNGEAENLVFYKSLRGNRPNIIILQDLLTPFSLGRLIALYEHRVFVEGILMGINSFDQWGVELGKEFADKLLPEVRGEKKNGSHDGSTLGLLEHIQKRRTKKCV
ncbi:glucose-6-phosphate isomerase [Bartonella ancashensis]|uniref:Glucose-6-phosphate isomerase n=1 Tax=Bartonella ancashensis TaxID=1318743 RepID=A0A0M3T2G8_9HYPH|nr:glucose-6-phosphate isomerase [Bartonella ancashensis]ALE02821.1 Glucose-6-phosphate isomerase [Bartonella ancashensis]